MKLRLAALTLLGTAFLIPAAAQAGGHSVEKFLEADTDQSGSVSKAEFTAKYDAKFTAIDSNADGEASGEEYEAYIAAKSEEYQKEKFGKMDSDGDGMISLQEFSEHKKSHKHKH